MMAILFLRTVVLLPLAAGLIVATPPKAKPVILGTSDYSNILFGKIQRAASLFGTNLGQPFSVLSKGDSLSKLDSCLWNKFCMANSGPSGIEEAEDIKLPLTSWIPNGNLTGAIVFVDAASCMSSSDDGGGNPLANIFSFGGKKKSAAPEPTGQPTVSEIDESLLAVAAARKCAHVYVLSDDASLSNCMATLARCANDVPCTIMVLEPKVTLAITNGWTSSRPQDMEGELTGPVAVESVVNPEGDRPTIPMSSTTFPVEDAAEVMLQVALRADRSPEKQVRVVRLKAGGELQERLNADYFTMVGGKKARATAGTVQSVSSWESVLSPAFGPVIGSLGINKQ
jgi:hypothetical protein